MAQSTAGPLENIVVVDLSRALAGPQATMMLGDMGARVIKVEAPGRGDESRGWGPPFVGPDVSPESTYFLSCNRNKESVTVNLKSPDGMDLLTQLVRHGDVLVENFRPGVMERLGFTVERLHEINPRLVILSISGFGHDGPQGGRPGYDQIAQGEAGLMSLTGPDADSPTRIGVPIADVLAGMNGAYGVLSALYERERTGRGKVVRTSLLASIVGVHAFQGTRYTVAGEVGRPTGNHHVAIAPYGLFRCEGGAVQVAVANEAQWATFAEIVGLDTADPRYAGNAERVAHRDDLVGDIEKTLLQRPAAHWLARLESAGIPAGEVRTLDQVYDCPQTRSQGLVIEVDHASLGTIELPGPAVRFDDGGRLRHAAPPRLGEHNSTVRAWLREQEG
ncbi:CoA transferase [Streptomyces sp. RPA4-5]|uniref:CaiB/BaiF CoA transferase family protein n=1 Tax=Streptomyces sp. RPA4-5 TaxID=2721245 RepID=UPI00143ED712|nr:CoA transferase [Streptomyces sp. RPA4-5]QIY53500.1 CoA transferase [Streptomyces sp. RPA4-5]